MQYLTVIAMALGLAAAVPSSLETRQAAPASFDRYPLSGCTGIPCNKAGAGDAQLGCNAITDSCTASLSMNYIQAGCRATLWTDSTCTSNNHFLNATTPGSCYALGPPIKSISIDC